MLQLPAVPFKAPPSAPAPKVQGVPTSITQSTTVPQVSTEQADKQEAEEIVGEDKSSSPLYDPFAQPPKSPWPDKQVHGLVPQEEVNAAPSAYDSFADDHSRCSSASPLCQQPPKQDETKGGAGVLGDELKAAEELVARLRAQQAQQAPTASTTPPPTNSEPKLDRVQKLKERAVQALQSSATSSSHKADLSPDESSD